MTDRALTVPETAEILRVGKDTVYAGCNAPEPHRWPHYRVGTGPRAAIRVLESDIPHIRRLLSRAPQPTPVPVDASSADVRRRRGAARLLAS
jgi:hypothetical protein